MDEREREAGGDGWLLAVGKVAVGWRDVDDTRDGDMERWRIEESSTIERVGGKGALVAAYMGKEGVFEAGGNQGGKGLRREGEEERGLQVIDAAGRRGGWGEEKKGG